MATYDATNVILVSREGDGYEEAAETLRERLRAVFRRVVLSRG